MSDPHFTGVMAWGCGAYCQGVGSTSREARGPPEEGDCGELGGDGDTDHPGAVGVVEDSEQPTAEEPGDPPGCLENSVSGGASLLGYDGGDDGFEDRLLRPHADSP